VNLGCSNCLKQEFAKKSVEVELNPGHGLIVYSMLTEESLKIGDSFGVEVAWPSA
jgi:hypothetical protein